MTIVESLTSWIVGWAVGYERTEAVMQELVDSAPQAVLHYSDDFFSTYSALLYSQNGTFPSRFFGLIPRNAMYAILSL